MTEAVAIPARRGLSREAWVNVVLLGLLVAVPLIAQGMGEPFIVTLATKVAILALAGVGLNLALGLGGHDLLRACRLLRDRRLCHGHLRLPRLQRNAGDDAALHGARDERDAGDLAGGDPVLGLAALVIGALSLRTSGVYFIMVTLAFAQMLYYFAISWPAYGGEDGLSFFVRNTFPGLNTLVPLHFFWICFALLLGGFALSAMLARSRFGLALEAIRQNRGRAVAVGIRPFPVQLTAFVISGMITGLAGALYADLNRFVSPTMLSGTRAGRSWSS
jgi:branched-chain amino acid transport system permease protein